VEETCSVATATLPEPILSVSMFQITQVVPLQETDLLAVVAESPVAKVTLVISEE
jgi:hypothetical protein